MSRPKSEENIFQSLCDEAARACPDGGMVEVERYVASRLATMDEDTRLAVAREMEQVLGFRAPDCPRFEQ